MIRTVKIMSDGTPAGSQVEDLLSGEVVPGVKSIRWQHDDPGDVPTCTIEVLMPVVEIESLAEFLFLDEEGNEYELVRKERD